MLGLSQQGAGHDQAHHHHRGHPDPEPTRLVHALAQAYADGARDAGHEVCLLRIADLGIPPLQSQTQWHSQALPEPVREAQEAITWCNQLLIAHPLWLDTMPAALKAFFEQVLGPGFAVDEGETGWNRAGTTTPTALPKRSKPIRLSSAKLPSPTRLWARTMRRLRARISASACSATACGDYAGTRATHSPRRAAAARST